MTRAVIPTLRTTVSIDVSEPLPLRAKSAGRSAVVKPLSHAGNVVLASLWQTRGHLFQLAGMLRFDRSQYSKR